MALQISRETWADFHADWEGLALECEKLREQFGLAPAVYLPEEAKTDDFQIPDDFTGETRRVFTEQRIKQNFFRRAVLASYRQLSRPLLHVRPVRATLADRQPYCAVEQGQGEQTEPQ